MKTSQDSPPVILLTGAGSGIGRAIAVQLAVEGASLFLVGRTHAKLDETAALLPAGSESIVIAGDVAESDFAAACVARAVERFGRLDALVNSAGVASVVPIGETSEELLEQTFAINAFGPALLVINAWPIFARQRNGRVVNISSIASSDPFPGFLAYAASKAALDSFTRSIAIEGEAIGVRAFSVNPGAVETPMLRSAFSEEVIPRSKTLDPATVARIAVDCALGRRDADNGRAIVVPSG